MAKKKKRYQRQFKFWLNAMSRQDQRIIEDIESLKDERSFTQAIRDGLRLIPSLMRGETDVLFEMFPAIKEKLFAQMEADVLERMGVVKDSEVIQHIIELKGVVSQIKNQPMLSAPMQGTVTMKRVTTVTDEEMVLDVKRDKNAGKRASENFLRSVVGATGNMLPITDDKPKALQPKHLTVAPIALPDFDDDDDVLPIKQLTSNEL